VNVSSKPFRRNAVKPGDRLVFTDDERIECIFKGLGHGGCVIASLVAPIKGRPHDVIGLQKHFRIAGPRS